MGTVRQANNSLTKGNIMTAIETLTKMNEDFQAVLIEVRAQYCTFDLAARLASRHGLQSVEDAFAEEAKRCRREKWAKVTAAKV